VAAPTRRRHHKLGVRAHYLQHVPFEGLGSIEPWLRAAGCALSGTRFFESASLPSADAIDLLIVMGGPMSVNDEAEHPWLVPERELIRRCVERGTAVLGVCLGAQLIARAMGAEVYRNHTKEIGWFPVHAVPAAGGATFGFPATVEAFHWHGETFDLPTGAVHVASSEACVHQAFQIGDATLALQFHLETTPETARALIAHCRAELVPSRYVQSEDAILAAPPARYRAVNDLMAEALGFLTRRKAAR